MRGGLLASYPRSGSTMVRMALAARGVPTGSLYDESERSSAYREAVGDPGETMPDGIVWKTHEPAELLKITGFPHPIVILVRDPRDVFISLQRWFKQSNNADYSPAELIMGWHPWGCWSNWVRAWMRYAPPHAVWVRYERWDARVLRAAGIQWDESAEKLPRHLADMRQDDPLMYGPGGYTDEQRAEFYGDDMDLLMLRHRSAMSALGYQVT